MIGKAFVGRIVVDPLKCVWIEVDGDWLDLAQFDDCRVIIIEPEKGE